MESGEKERVPEKEGRGAHAVTEEPRVSEREHDMRSARPVSGDGLLATNHHHLLLTVTRDHLYLQ